MSKKSAIISVNDRTLKVSRERLKPVTFLPLELEEIKQTLSELRPISKIGDISDLELDSDIPIDSASRRNDAEVSRETKTLPYQITSNEIDEPFESEKRIRKQVRRYGSNVYDT